MERLQKVIASTGYCSRRKAEELIEKGLVFVDGKPANIGDKCEEGSEIKVKGELISVDNSKYYYILNKPKGILVTRDDPQKRKTIYDLESVKKLEEKFGRLNYVGRLDGMSEGMLILTNDGEFQNELTHPSRHVAKTYRLRIEPQIRERDVEQLKKGLIIDNRRLFADISNISKNEFDITIEEGRNRIIRKSMDKLGYKIFMLRRIGIGNLKLNSLGMGEVKEIKKSDVLC